jgi:hypothetical protein
MGAFSMIDIWSSFNSVLKQYKEVLQGSAGRYLEEVTDLLNSFAAVSTYGTLSNNFPNRLQRNVLMTSKRT